MSFGSTPVDTNAIPIGSVYVPGTGFVAQQGSVKTFTDTSSNVSAPINTSSQPSTQSTYTYTIAAALPYATPTDWVVLRGSASKIVTVMRIEASVVATAATAGLKFTIKKHTIANTAGTSTTPTIMQHDSADAAPTASILLYSAAPTINASAYIWKKVIIDVGVVTPVGGTWAQDRFVYDYNDDAYDQLTLRGVAEECAINFNSVAVLSGTAFDYSITWVEN